jgi:hypothetical protein
MPVQDWSATADENTTVDGINIAEHCPAKNMNDALRAVMASVKKNDASVVHTADAETITGAKTFTEKLFLAPKEDDRWLQTYIYGTENAASLKIQNRIEPEDLTGELPARSSLTLEASDNAGQGRFTLRAQSKTSSTGDGYKQWGLVGTSDGSLTWTGGNYSSLGHIEIVDSSSLSSSIGYIRYSSGLQICWGGPVQLNGQVTDTNKRVTFPVAFSAVPSILTTNSANVGNHPVAFGWESKTAFSIGTMDKNNSTGHTSWVAIGPWK